MSKYAFEGLENYFISKYGKFRAGWLVGGSAVGFTILAIVMFKPILWISILAGFIAINNIYRGIAGK